MQKNVTFLDQLVLSKVVQEHFKKQGKKTSLEGFPSGICLYIDKVPTLHANYLAGFHRLAS